jgi:endonuclease/exonuclease/phosphatase (EEP) superfamily protein YafD
VATSENEHWLIRICDFPRLQIIFLLSASLIVFIFFPFDKRWITLVVGGVIVCCIIFQTYTIWPYTGLHPVQVKRAEKDDPANQFSVLYSNVYMYNRRSSDALKEMQRKNPDMILAVEVDEWWAKELSVLKEKYKYVAELPLENTYGMILYSRLKIEESDFKYLVNPDIPSLQPIITLPSGAKVKCYFIHPKPPAPQEAETSVQRDKELMIVARESRKLDMPVIVAGDLNDVGWSFTSRLFQKNSGLLDPRVGRGFYPTFNAKYPFFRWPLDHVFVSREFRIVELQRMNFMGSDHFPIYFRVSYEPEIKTEQELPVPDTEEIKKGDEKLTQSNDA